VALQEKYTTYRPTIHVSLIAKLIVDAHWGFHENSHPIGNKTILHRSTNCVCMYVCMLWNVWGVCIGKLQDTHNLVVWRVFFVGEVLSKRKKIKWNTFKMKWFWRVSIAKSEKENSQNSQISLFGFQLGAVNIECRLKIYTSYLVYSQVWLNLPMDDHHLLNILRWLQVRLHFFFKLNSVWSLAWI
jgi:hypothetical protein